jgi:hypothetical protein
MSLPGQARTNGVLALLRSGRGGLLEPPSQLHALSLWLLAPPPRSLSSGPARFTTVRAQLRAVRGRDWLPRRVARGKARTREFARESFLIPLRIDDSLPDGLFA